MSDSTSILTRRSYFYGEDQSAKLSVYIKQQKIIKALRKLTHLDEEELQTLIDKVLDTNDPSIVAIYEKLCQFGIEQTVESIKRIRMSKNK